MKDRIRPYMTAGIAIVGASVIAVTPIAPKAQDIALPTRTHQVSLMADAQAAAIPPIDFEHFAQLVTYINDRHAPVAPENIPVAQRFVFLAASFAASGQRLGEAVGLLPLGLLNVATAYMQGTTQGNAALADFIENTVDGPLWIADPVLYGLRDTTDPPAGGGGGTIETFRDQLWQSTEDINNFLLNMLGLPNDEAPAQNNALVAGVAPSGTAGSDTASSETALDTVAPTADAIPPTVDWGQVLTQVWQATLTASTQPGPVAYKPVPALTGDPGTDQALRIGEGVVATGIRFGTALVEFPLGVVQVLGAVLSPTFPQVLSNFIANTVDAPLWVADPFLYSLRDALPAAQGGGAGGSIETFRDSLWQGTQDINTFIQHTFGLPPDTTGNSTSAAPQRNSLVSTQKSGDASSLAPAAADSNVVAISDNTQKLDSTFKVKPRNKDADTSTAITAGAASGDASTDPGKLPNLNANNAGDQNGNGAAANGANGANGGKAKAANTGGKHRKAG